jgi:hypothetical protein
MQSLNPSWILGFLDSWILRVSSVLFLAGSAPSPVPLPPNQLPHTPALKPQQAPVVVNGSGKGKQKSQQGLAAKQQQQQLQTQVVQGVVVPMPMPMSSPSSMSIPMSMVNGSPQRSNANANGVSVPAPSTSIKSLLDAELAKATVINGVNGKMHAKGQQAHAVNGRPVPMERNEFIRELLTLIHVSGYYQCECAC